MNIKLVGALGLALLVGVSPAHCASFDQWSLFFNSSDNHFDSGPTVATTAGDNSLGVAFSNTVFGPAIPIPRFSNSGCTGLCSNFYYTLPMQFKIYSQSVNVIAGTTYVLQFNVVSSNFNSTADYFVQTPSIDFEYLSSNPLVTGCEQCAIAIVPNETTTFSVDFTPLVTGPIEFGLDWTAGRNPNGAVSSSVNPFTESGSYQYSDFSIIAPSVTPVPDTLPLFAAVLGGLAFFGWRRRPRSPESI